MNEHLFDVYWALVPAIMVDRRRWRRLGMLVEGADLKMVGRPVGGQDFQQSQRFLKFDQGGTDWIGAQALPDILSLVLSCSDKRMF